MEEAKRNCVKQRMGGKGKWWRGRNSKEEKGGERRKEWLTAVEGGRDSDGWWLVEKKEVVDLFY